MSYPHGDKAFIPTYAYIYINMNTSADISYDSDMGKTDKSLGSNQLWAYNVQRDDESRGIKRREFMFVKK